MKLIGVLLHLLVVAMVEPIRHLDTVKRIWQNETESTVWTQKQRLGRRLITEYEANNFLQSNAQLQTHIIQRKNKLMMPFEDHNAAVVAKRFVLKHDSMDAIFVTFNGSFLLNVCSYFFKLDYRGPKDKPVEIYPKNEFVFNYDITEEFRDYTFHNIYKNFFKGFLVVFRNRVTRSFGFFYHFLEEKRKNHSISFELKKFNTVISDELALQGLSNKEFEDVKFDFFPVNITPEQMATENLFVLLVKTNKKTLAYLVDKEKGLKLEKIERDYNHISLTTYNEFYFMHTISRDFLFDELVARQVKFANPNIFVNLETRTVVGFHAVTKSSNTPAVYMVVSIFDFKLDKIIRNFAIKVDHARYRISSDFKIFELKDFYVILWYDGSWLRIFWWEKIFDNDVAPSEATIQISDNYLVAANPNENSLVVESNNVSYVLKILPKETDCRN